MYKLNFGEDPKGDITELDPKKLTDFDVLVGGFPCQSFSICGKQKGFEDARGTLFLTYVEFLKRKNHMHLC